jgi:site-specific DNA recombinase
MVEQVEVDEIRIIGRRTVLKRLAMGRGAVPARMPSFVQKWRTRHDSNV